MSKKKILIADDDPPVRRVLSMCLTSAGYEVLTVTNGQEALTAVATFEPDALLTDINMPKMSGRELCETISQEYPSRDFRIFVMTANVARDDREWVDNLSNIVFLEKPLSPRMVVSMLADYFNEATQ